MKISEVTRRNIIDYILLLDQSFHGRLDIVGFLRRIWDLSSMPSTDYRFTSADKDIWQHMVNNDDWNEHYLLYDYLDIINVNDEVFLKFLEETLHPVVVEEDCDVDNIVKEYNKRLEKDGYRLEISSQISGKPLYKAISTSGQKEMNDSDVYEVVLSFAGENRNYVERVAEYLRNNNVKLFYDKYEEVTLWGKDLVEHLQKVYRGSARYCIMFISVHYKDKVWTTHERRSAFERAIQEKEEYILPARFDDTEIPGLSSTIGYVDISHRSPEEFGELILKKLGIK